MGIYYQAVIFYGLPYEELEGSVENLEEMTDNGEVDTVSPYYDAPQDEGLVGFMVEASPDYGWTEIYKGNYFEEAKRRFEEVFGRPGKLYISTHGG